MDYTNNRDQILDLLSQVLSEDKFTHCLAVEKTAIELARNYQTDEGKAGLAGLLHDVTKCMDNVSLAKEYGLKNYTSKKTLHAYTGAIYIERNGITKDIDVINAVKYHTTGREAMSMLEKIIYLADLIEPGREYQALDKIRPVCYQDIDGAMLLSLKMSIKLIIKRSTPIDLNTVFAYNYYSRIKNDPAKPLEENEWKFPKKPSK
ncbi:MAG: bis(5'-nucleosyl)-tetraphosphatase (symmetrical) YqeK [Eubacteriales bacterium]